MFIWYEMLNFSVTYR